MRQTVSLLLSLAMFVGGSVSSFGQDIPRPQTLAKAREYKGSIGTRLLTSQAMVDQNYHFLFAYQLVEPAKLPVFVFADSGGEAHAGFIPGETKKNYVWTDPVKTIGVGSFVFVILNYGGKPTPEVIQQFSLYVGPETTIKNMATQLSGQLADGQLIKHGSTSVQPPKGPRPFKITYQLNDIAHVAHRIVKGIDEVWFDRLTDQPPGQKSWSWDRTKRDKSRAAAGSDYSAQEEAEAPSDPKVRGTDGEPFEVTN